VSKPAVITSNPKACQQKKTYASSRNAEKGTHSCTRITSQIALTDGMVKGIAGEEPGYIVERCRRGEVAHPRGDKRESEVFEEIGSENFV